MSDVSKSLSILADLVATAAAAHEELRKRCDDLYDARVAQIAKEHSCSMSRAHGIARDDAIAKRAYELGLDVQRRQTADMHGADMVGHIID